MASKKSDLGDVTVTMTGPGGVTTGPMSDAEFHSEAGMEKMARVIEKTLGGAMEDQPIPGGMKLGEFKKQVLGGLDPDQPYPGIPLEELFEETGKEFLDDEDLTDIGKMLVKGRFTNLHARNAKIRFVWKAKGGGDKGRNKLGECSKVGGKTRIFTDTHFIIWLAADHLRAMKATRYQVEALVFHELCHAGIEPDTGPFIIGHDYEGFLRELAEYGPWKQDLAAVVKVSRQLELPLNFTPVPPPPEEKAEGKKQRTLKLRKDTKVEVRGSEKTH